jgi:Carboxypeptidase regulatory-like domain
MAVPAPLRRCSKIPAFGASSGQIQLLMTAIVLEMLSACGGGKSIPPNSGNVNPSQPPPTDNVSGSVTFKGTPLAGATITAWLTNTNTIVQTAITDASGNYSFSGLPAWQNVDALYQFWASKPGYGFYPSVGSGASVIRFDHTVNYQGNGVSDIAIYLTVIQYSA